jgi:hypothetical protein
MREARLAKGFTQEELVRGLATKGLVSQVEHNRTTPSLPLLRLPDGLQPASRDHRRAGRRPLVHRGGGQRRRKDQGIPQRRRRTLPRPR